MSSTLVTEKKLENLTLKREVRHNNSSNSAAPRPTLPKEEKKEEEKYEPEHATVATLLGSGEGIIRMDYPSFSCDLKIAEHTKSRPCVSGCLLFACIKVKIALCFLTLILCQWR